MDSDFLSLSPSPLAQSPECTEKLFDCNSWDRMDSPFFQIRSLSPGFQSHGGTTTEGFDNHPFATNSNHRIIGREGISDLLEKTGVINGEHTHLGSNPSLEGGSQSRGGGTTTTTTTEGFSNHPLTNSNHRITGSSTGGVSDFLEKMFINGKHTCPGSNILSLDGGSQSRGGTATEGFNNHPFTKSNHRIIRSEGISDLLEKTGVINGEHTHLGSNPSLEGGSQSRGGTATEGFNNHPCTNSNHRIIGSEGISSDLLDKRFINGEHTRLGSNLSQKGAAGTSSSPGDRDTSLQSRDSPVKVRIKPFMVPELVFEVPEKLTNGSLKRKVVEELTTFIEDKVPFDVLEWKMVVDNNKTILHNGISHDRGPEVMPGTKPLPHLCPHGSDPMLPCNVNQPLTRCLPTPPVVHQGSSNVSSHPLAILRSFIRVCQDPVESHTAMSIDKSAPASYGATSLPAISSGPPIGGSKSGNSNQSKNLNRRSPRPFTCSEVETLVQAVDEHGTGRWQEIQERTFKNASNRTYTDLKDKWRTLVKTAKQPANKRRGAVLPQELLDRVLAIENRNYQQLAR